MAPSEIITDTSLHSVLAAAQQARDQSIAILDLLDAHPQPSNAAPHAARDLELSLSKQQKALYSYLSRVRSLNRAAIVGVRQTKEETAEARSEVDRLHLHLQNLYYEQRHLRGEIVACQEYEYVVFLRFVCGRKFHFPFPAPSLLHMISGVRRVQRLT